MSNNNESGWFFVLIFLGLIAWQLAPADGHKQNVYYRYCPDLTHNSFSCPEKTRVMKLSYMIFPATQKVVGKGLFDNGKCVVFDEENWVCEDKGQQSGMRDGDVFDYPASTSLDELGNKSFLPRYNQIWGLTYYTQSMIDMFR